MQRVLAALAFAALTTLPVVAQDSPQILADRLDRDQQGIGLVTAVIENDTPRFASHGVLAADSDVPVSETTLFEIGSLSKIFTNLLLAQLVLDGKMALDAPVADYLPAGTTLPRFEGQDITLFDLASQSAGLPPIPPELMFADPANPYKFYSADMLYAFLAAYPLPRAPGTQFEYSNIGATLIAEAMSQVTGQSYADLVQQHILDPLGMDETMLDVPDALADRFATGHDEQGQPVSHWDFDVFAPAGGWRSTALDMAKFAAAASGQRDTPLKDAFALMLDDTRPAGSPDMRVGLGWMLLERPDGTTVWHNGITGGFNAFLGFDRASGKAALVLGNAVTATGIEDIGFHLVDPDAPLAPQPTPRSAVDIDPALLQNYVGTYELGPEFHLTVTAKNAHLLVQATGQGQLMALPESDTRFFLTEVDAQISFSIDADGKATGLTLHQNGQDIAGKRQ